jgi:hypothetical protein
LREDALTDQLDIVVEQVELVHIDVPAAPRRLRVEPVTGSDGSARARVGSAPRRRAKFHS